MLFRDKICGVVAVGRATDALAQLERALRLTKTVELRLDWLEGDSEIEQFLDALADRYASGGKTRGRTAPTLIATCRRVEAGGKFRGSAAERGLFLARALRSGCTWYDLDVETAAVAPPELLDVLIGEGRGVLFSRALLPAGAREFARRGAEARGVSRRCGEGRGAVRHDWRECSRAGSGAWTAWRGGGADQGRRRCRRGCWRSGAAGNWTVRRWNTTPAPGALAGAMVNLYRAEKSRAGQRCLA